MPLYTQDDKPLTVNTPLGKDALLLTAVQGTEAISQLFNFKLDLLAELQTPIQFERIIGQNAAVELRLVNGEKRYFHGLIKRFSQAGNDRTFAHFSAEIVPRLWLLTKKVRSRIFQQITVPDILRQALDGLDVAYELSANYYPRDYCVQYGETDFEFVSRLMEEEGIYYFFRHSDSTHQMVVTDNANQHPSVAIQYGVPYDDGSGGVWDEMRITRWEKSQELRSGKVTLWDYCFELPGNHLEADETTIDGVKVGDVVHHLLLGGNDDLEIYEYPGGFAQRFDGVDRHGGPTPAELQDIFKDNQRTARIRMEQEETASLEVGGSSDCGHFVPGHKFTLQRHFNADGDYLLTRVEHKAHLGAYATGKEQDFTYENRFAAIPTTLAYRPQRVTRKPVIAGIQTATVAGPESDGIYCDQYGRVKVQFHWDREGKNDGDSSCWLRVAQIWAGNRWGAFFWPRVGHEVVVTFEEGDPDQPIVIGSVYNAANMPPLVLPATNMFCGIKSQSVRGKANENFNSIVFVDKKGMEHMAIQSERHMVINAEFDVDFRAGRHHFQRIPGAHVTTVGSLPGGGGSGGDGEVPRPNSMAGQMEFPEVCRR